MYLLHGQKAPQDERLYLVEEGINRRHPVERYEVQLQLPDPPLAAELLVVALCSFLSRGWKRRDVVEG